jgi:3-dehydroquinate synthase
MIAAAAARVRVDLGDARSYDVVIGGDVVAAVRDVPAQMVAVLYDRKVDALAQRTLAALGERVSAVRAVDGGEDLKTLAHAADLYDWLAGAHLDRDALLIAIGGGTVTDLGGYVAATFLRGIRWCALPTTLLAAVDASVGGKTGVNIAAGKNLVGAFHHPALVAIDPGAFATLDSRDLAAGLGEALKTALVADPALFALFEREMPRALAADPHVLATIVAHCVAAKARVVAGDERERDETGGRAVLNFGHTFGHALEKTCGYGTLRHGEAVTLGMRAAIALSRDRGLVADLADRIDGLIRAIPTPPVALAPDAVIAATASDKKRKAGRVRFIVIDGIASPKIVDDVDEPALRAALATLAG